MEKRLKSGDISESSIQKAVMQWVNLNPILRKVVIHVPNEGKRTKSYGKLLKDMGMRSGVSDLFIAMPRHGYGGAWFELKKKNGLITENQRKFLNDMHDQHYFTAICYSIEETIETIQWYCFDDNAIHAIR